MGLPIQQSAPVYNLTVPSTNKKVGYRPFLVKEEKALLLAEQSEDVDFMIETLKKIIADCTFNKLETDSLAVFDLEYILTKLRAKSIGEIVDLNVTCKNCKEASMVKLDISNLEVTKNPDHTNKIPLFDDVGVVMKYPRIDILHNLTKDEVESNVMFDAILECIDYIYDSVAIFHAKEQSKEELNIFLDNLTREQLDKIENFFQTMPKLEVQLDFTCPKCGHENSRKIEGIQNFF